MHTLQANAMCQETKALAHWENHETLHFRKQECLWG